MRRCVKCGKDTIIIGVDIASEVHYARVFDWRGIELGRVFSFENSGEGFERFLRWINELKAKHGKTAVDELPLADTERACVGKESDPALAENLLSGVRGSVRKLRVHQQHDHSSGGSAAGGSGGARRRRHQRTVAEGKAAGGRDEARLAAIRGGEAHSGQFRGRRGRQDGASIPAGRLREQAKAI